MINLTNQFLVASPGLCSEPIFSNTVVYIAQHDDKKGAVGVIINRPINKTVNQVLKNIDIKNSNKEWSQDILFWGGPLCSYNGYVLHKLIDNNVQIFELTNNRGVLKEMVEDNECHDIFMSLGYCGWTESRLEYDIINDNWLIIPAKPSIIFEVEPTSRYDEALHLLGIKHVSQLLSQVDPISS